MHMHVQLYISICAFTSSTRNHKTRQGLRALGVNATGTVEASDAVEVGQCLPGIRSLSFALYENS